MIEGAAYTLSVKPHPELEAYFDELIENIYRKGTLHFFHNTVVSTRTGNTTLLRLSTNDEAADVRNNVCYVTAEGSRLAMLNEAGQLTLRHNWTKPGWQASHGGLTGAIDDDASGITGAVPGFAGEAAADYRLAPGAQAADQGGALHPDVLPAHEVGAQYLVHQASQPRASDGQPDLGAFEVGALSGDDVIFADDFESGDVSAWSSVAGAAGPAGSR